MTAFRRFAFTVLASSTALALASCGSKDSTASGLAKAAPVAAVAAPAGQMWSDVVSATPDGGMRMGNPNAPIKVIEYGALSCPHCAKLSNDGDKTLVDKYVNSGRVSYEFRSYIIHGSIDVVLTMLVQCADKSAFFPLVQQIYATQDQWIAVAEKAGAQAQAAGNLPPAQRFAGLADAYGLTDWFAARGLSKDQAHACLSKPENAQAIAARTQKWYQDQGIDSTPTLFINGSKLEVPAGTEPWDALNAALQNAGAR